MINYCENKLVKKEYILEGDFLHIFISGLSKSEFKVNYNQIRDISYLLKRSSQFYQAVTYFLISLIAGLILQFYFSLDPFLSIIPLIYGASIISLITMILTFKKKKMALLTLIDNHEIYIVKRTNSFNDFIEKLKKLVADTEDKSPAK